MTDSNPRPILVPGHGVGLISDELLSQISVEAELATHLGDLGDQTQAILSVVLPEICEELLRWRAFAASGSLCIAVTPEAIAGRLEEARRIIRAPDPIKPDALRAACETLYRHSGLAAERQAAAEILDQMDAPVQAAAS